MPPKSRIAKGQRYGRLVVLRITDDAVRDRRGHIASRIIECQCDCGNKSRCPACALTAGNTKSCGCLKIEAPWVERGRKKHSSRRTPEYLAWVAIRQRCNRPRAVGYESYGGRGIGVCDRWNHINGGFENFIFDMGPRPDGKTSIDRIDNEGNYEPGNCRWANDEEQSRNKRSNIMLTFQGRTTCATDWANELRISLAAVRHRMKMGYPIEAILSSTRYTRWTSRAT